MKMDVRLEATLRTFALFLSVYFTLGGARSPHRGGTFPS
jgi:hypothetical protein